MTRQRASWVFASLDFVMAAIYASLFLWVIPSRETLFTVIALTVSVVLAAGGVGMVTRASWGPKVATWSSILMLVWCGALVVLLVASAAYLHGIYGGVGQAGTALALILALLIIEVVGLLPALQLYYLRRQAAPSRPQGGEA